MTKFTSMAFGPPAIVASEQVYATRHKTAVVLGVPQGGTSMLAAIVDALGVPISEELHNFETDARPHCGDDQTSWLAKVAKINSELVVWGLKDTLLPRFSPRTIHNSLRNPYYLLVAKETVSVVQRRAANHGVTEPVHILSLLREAEAQVRSLWNWVYGLGKAPLLLVSYERAIRHRSQVCEAVASFLGLNPRPEDLTRAIARISTVGGYLEEEDGTTR